MVRTGFFLLLFLTLVRGESPTLQTIDNYPRSLAKDFYIWHFLHTKDLNASTVERLFDQTHHVNKKLFKAYAQKSPHKEIKQTLRCFKLSHDQMLNSKDPSCLALSLSPHKAAGFSPFQRKKLIRILEKEVPNTARWLHHMNSTKDMVRYFIKKPEEFLYLFKKVGSSFRSAHYNHRVTQAFLDALSEFEDFDKFVEIIAIDKNLQKLQKSLLYFEPRRPISAHAHFYIALIKIMHDHHTSALKNLEFAAQNDYFQIDRDRALFWSYLLTGQSDYLEQLYRSTDLNIYTLYAAEKLGKKPIGVFQPQLDRAFDSPYSQENPFIWSQLVQRDHNISAERACQILPAFENQNTESLYAFYLEKCSNYALHPYITPYENEVKNLPAVQRALFYALGRQESRLIPGGLSRVYAMGMMQIMPFVSKAIAKQKKIHLKLPEMFSPKRNIDFAKHHLKYLNRKLKHPLLIAYAYNGGIGFLKRVMKQGFFKRRSIFEPFLSMELIPYPETRKYGKKVLANYIIYRDIFNKPTSLTHLLRTLR